MNLQMMTKKVFLLFAMRVLSHNEFDYFVDSKAERTRLTTTAITKNQLLSRLVILNGILKTNIIKEDPGYALQLLQSATRGYEAMLKHRENTLRGMSKENQKLFYERLEKFIIVEKELQYALFLQIDRITPMLRPLEPYQVPQNVW